MPVPSSDYLVTRDHLRVVAARLAHQLSVAYPTPRDLPMAAEATVPHLQWMCRVVEQNVNSWPVDKVGRWIGFVQGAMAAQGLLSVRRERDATRAGLREAYEADGLPVPPSIAPPRWDVDDLVVGVFEGQARRGHVVAVVDRLDPHGDAYQARVEVEWSGNAHPRQTAHDPRELVAAYEVLTKDPQ